MGEREPAISDSTRTRKTCRNLRKRKRRQFEFVVKMAVIIKDLMNGNQELPGAVL